MDARRRPAAEVIWTPGAEAALLRLTPWGATERAARAVYELAATGRGNLRRRGTSPTEFSLYVSSICIRLSFEREERRITVWHVFVLH